MHSSSNRTISIFDIPEDDLKKIIEVLQNDLKEYESLESDFGKGTEEALKKLIKVVQPHLESSSSESKEESQ